MKDKHIIVVGAGIIGLCSAYFLNKKGFQVTILDNTDGTDNCSYGNAGFFSPSHLIPLASPGIISQGLRWMMRSDSPFYIKPKLDFDLISWGLKFKQAATKTKVAAAAPILNDLLLSSRDLIEKILEEESIDAGLNDKGLVIYCKTQRALDEEMEMAELAQKYGQQTKVLNLTQARAINPDMEINARGAVLFENDASITPHIFMAELKQVLLKNGVEINHNVKVDKLVSGKSGSIEKIIANGTEHVADEYLLATGSWTRDLLKQVDLKLPLQAGKGYSFVLPSPKANLNSCAILNEARVAVTPMKHGLRFAGTMEVNGMDLSINSKRVQGIINAIPEFFPQFSEEDFKDIEPWAGLRPCSPDGMPYVGRTKKYNNLLVATGHAMLGISLGPVTGKIIAQLASNEASDTDLGLLSVDRYN